MYAVAPGSYPREVEGGNIPVGYSEVAPPPAYDAATQILGWRGDHWHVKAISAADLALMLADSKVSAIAANNAAAGRAREAYLTAVPGQATTYAAKQAEVARWIVGGRTADATAAAYPWAGDRAELRSVTVAEVLSEWEAVTVAWESVGRRIEAERERVNLLIDVANDLSAIQAGQDGAVYPSP